jgi:TorA maturation chaperone TorD
MTEIEEAKVRLRMAIAQGGSSRNDIIALLAHVDRLEALSTPAPDDPVERIVAWLKAENFEQQWDRETAETITRMIERGDWKLPAPSAIPEARDE